MRRMQNGLDENSFRKFEKDGMRKKGWNEKGKNEYKIRMRRKGFEGKDEKRMYRMSTKDCGEG